MSDSPLLRYPQGESPTPGQMSMQAAGDGEVPVENGEGEDLGDDVDAFKLEMYMKDRRRAKSLPAYPEEVSLLEGINGNNGRKRVKFADSLGLNLASVKHFSSLEEPQIPTKVLSRLRSFPPHQQLHEDHLDDLYASFKSSLTIDRLVACFPVPGEDKDFEMRVKLHRVALEKVTITQFDIRGQIRVHTTGDCPKKEVGVRYTFNDWLSNVDAQALPVPVDDSYELVGERFAFTMYTPPFYTNSCPVHFAVYLRSDEGEFWDNNAGQNYTLKYHSMPSVTPFVSAAFHAT